MPGEPDPIDPMDEKALRRTLEELWDGQADDRRLRDHLPGMTYLLGTTGFSGSGFTGTGGFDLLAEAAEADDGSIEPALGLLRERYHVSTQEVAEALGLDAAAASRILVRLCRQGRCMFDVESPRYRHRELFEEPADEAIFLPPDRRRELAAKMLEEGRVDIESCEVQETTVPWPRTRCRTGGGRW